MGFFFDTTFGFSHALRESGVAVLQVLRYGEHGDLAGVEVDRVNVGFLFHAASFLTLQHVFQPRLLDSEISFLTMRSNSDLGSNPICFSLRTSDLRQTLLHFPITAFIFRRTSGQKYTVTGL